MKNDESIWRRLTDTVAYQMRSGWLLIPISVAVTVAVIRIGVVSSCLTALAVVGAILARKYRVRIHRRDNRWSRESNGSTGV